MNTELLSNKKKKLKIIALLLAGGGVSILFYLFFLPLVPAAKYELIEMEAEKQGTDWGDIDTIKEKIKTDVATEDIKDETEIEPNKAVKSLTIKNKIVQPLSSTNPNRLIIPKIGVNVPIIVSENGVEALNRGAWLVPEGSMPDEKGTAIITGHRYRYLPPSNLTFFLLDKLEVGDIASVLWNERYYYYRVQDKTIKPAGQASFFEINPFPALILFTCDPVYSTKNRLVISAKLIEE